MIQVQNTKLSCGSTPTPSSQQIGPLSLSFCVSPVQLTDGGGGGGRGDENYDRKKAWASLNRTILSAHKYKTSLFQICKIMRCLDGYQK